MKKAFAFAFCIICAVALCSCSALGTNASSKYRDVEDGVGLYRYSGVSTVTELIIPDEVEGKPLVEIMEFSVANGVYLKEITIGANVKRISARGFINCPELVKFIVDPANEYFETDEYGVLFTKGKTELLFYPNSAATNGAYVIPDSVTKVNDYAFYACANLNGITFGTSVQIIGTGAFIKCENLNNFVLPASLTEIGDDAFSYCNSLTAVSIPSGVKKIGQYAFYSQATKIESIVVYSKESDVECGKNWLPTKNGMNSGKIVPVFEG